MATVWVAMSGGVDSSVAAARLMEAGHHVTGVTMQLLPEGEDVGRCCSTDALRSARRVCEALGIDHYALNMRDVFRRDVIEPFVAAYAAGATPNPCIECNQQMKFSRLLAKARTHGADALATGHYARITEEPGGARWLARAADRAKDQSYFLYRLTEPALDHVLFPLGEVSKEWVRAEAERLGLPSATRPESQEVCFVPRSTASFVIGCRPAAGRHGPVVDTSGKTIGTHRGIGRYTVGQRKGLGLAGGPWYVSGIRPDDNMVVVAHGVPVAAERIDLVDTVWRGDDIRQVDVVVRYRSRPVAAHVTRTRTGLSISLENALPCVATGQAVVCYVGDRVVGGGVVDRTR